MLVRLFALLIITFMPVGGYAAMPSLTTEVKEVVPETPTDKFGRETPKGMVGEFMNAIGDENYTRAAEYLDLSYLPKKDQEAKGPELAKNLQDILDNSGRFTRSTELSDEPGGWDDDGLGDGVEKIGIIKSGDNLIDMQAVQKTNAEGLPIWLIAPSTLQQIPALLKKTESTLIDKILPSKLNNSKIAGVPIGQWLAFPIICAFAYGVVWVIFYGLIFLVDKFFRRLRVSRAASFFTAAIPPVRLYLAVVLFFVATHFLGFSLIARRNFFFVGQITAWLALLWLTLRIIDVFAELAKDKLRNRGQFAALSAVVFFRRSLKILLAILAGIGILDSFGFDVTTGLAALGIGGIALALGAQKTVENFVGSLTIIIDRPIRIGDYCRFGNIKGTVEDIGMRSTRIRTYDKTLVTIPNGQFAGAEIENYSLRDQFWFHPLLKLNYNTKVEQVNAILKDIRELLGSHEKISKDSRATLIEFANDSIVIEIFAYVNTSDYIDFLMTQEELMLKIMDIITRNGSAFASPSQTVYLPKNFKAS